VRCVPRRVQISIVKRGDNQMPTQAQLGVDNSILEMAVVGYQREVGRISAKIADIKAQLGKRGPGRPKAAPATVTRTDQAAPAKRGTMSKAGRVRVAAAQRARWAAQKQQGAAPAKPKKRKLSAAGLKAIREATKKRWAAYRKAHGSAA
jgi:hypothetical protein